jgi:beta-glucosidase
VLSHGDTYVSVAHDQLLADPGTHGPTMVQLAYDFVAGRHYVLSMRWFEYDGLVPKLSWQYVTPMIRAAAAAAARAAVAVVFAGNESTEGADNPSLGLSGVQDQLIEAVARSNPDTVVVLDTGGAVLMPWLGSVRAVLEAWYPGEFDGTAVAALLSGAVDPAGRLPVTFPASAAMTSVPVPGLYPGVDGVVDLSAAGDGGLEIGYRYYQAHHVKVLFPFGYGLSYTDFSLRHLSVMRRTPRGATGGGTAVTYAVSVAVSDTGGSAGTDVVEVYLAYPPAADEPPLALKAFASVSLRPGETRTARIELSPTAFLTWGRRGFVTVPGRYEIEIGNSSSDLQLRASIRPTLRTSRRAAPPRPRRGPGGRAPALRSVR